jgi:hypothetical protein
MPPMALERPDAVLSLTVKVVELDAETGAIL